jgi:DNA polymerase-3 subunit delta'
MAFSTFVGNASIVQSLREMLTRQRLPQTLLFAGPRGVGKATLARLLAAALNCRVNRDDPCGECSSCKRILSADLSLEAFQDMLAERDKLTSSQRAENPLVVSTHPDFLIFPPDGPLQLITIEQARKLTAAARLAPSEGKRQVFLIDHADRANDEASNSLLKILEEPPPSLTLILTAENPYDLLPTIRSRSIPFFFAPLSPGEMEQFFRLRNDLPEQERGRLKGWAQGSPGRAVSLDVEEYSRRRDAMLALLRVALGKGTFNELLPHTEAGSRRPQEKLEHLGEILHTLLQDVLHLRFGSPSALINEDIQAELSELARSARFDWFERACSWMQDLDELRRRNIQKQLALEALAMELRSAATA